MKRSGIVKQLAVFLLACVMLVGVTACSANNAGTTNDSNDSTSQTATTDNSNDAASTDTTAGTGNESIDKLNVYFVPSRDPEEIVTITEPLKALLKDELAKDGFDVGEVNISVGTSYEAVGEALSAGTADVGFIPGGTYVLYDDGAEVILTATRAGLSKDSENPKDWNDGQPTEAGDQQVNYYKGLVIAGPTEKGKELAAKVNAGQELTYDDLASANWSVMSSSSSSGYIYPTLWLQKNFGGKSLTDLPNIAQADSYGSSFARLASGEADIVVAYADARRDYADKWTSDLGRSQSIWDETAIIGVTDNIFNDTISVSKNSKIMTDDLKAALQTAFINIAQTDEGKQVIAVYSHQGYVVAQSSDYDNERSAQQLIKEINSNN